MCSECHIKIESNGDVVFRDDEGNLHCHDGPAIIWPGYYTAYYRHGYKHRDGDLPAVIWDNGSIEYWVNGCLHREDGLPARIQWDGSVEYWVKGILHREGRLPARIWANATRPGHRGHHYEYWENGTLVKLLHEMQ